MPRKVQALSLSEFHEAIGPTTTADPAEVLPDGPSGLASDVPTRKWISEWDGRAELLPVEIPPPAAPTPLKTEPEFKEALDLCLSEFFSSGDLAEATRCVVELHSPEFHLHIVKRGVRIAMDKADREREMIAVLFATLHARKVLSSKQAAQGFQALAESLSDGDLTLDCPDAAGLLAHFLADAVLDGLLPASALREWPDELRADPLGASLLDAVGRRLNGRQPIGGSQVDPKEIVKQLHSCLEEYLSSHDVAEVERRLRELQIPPDRQHLLVRKAVEMGIERKGHDRELVSQLLSRLFEEQLHLKQPQLTRGFEALLERVEDFTVDNPQAPTLLAAFLVRAVSDDLLPPAFARTLPPEALSSAQHRDTLTQARAQLDATHFSGHRQKVWGPAADADLPTLKEAVSEIAREYFVSCEVTEAVRCVRELDAPPFGHEVIKRLFVLALDGGARHVALAEQLVQRLCDEAVVPPQQLALGCERLLDAAADLAIDNPQTPTELAGVLERFCECGHLVPPEEWRASIESLRARG